MLFQKTNFLNPLNSPHFQEHHNPAYHRQLKEKKNSKNERIFRRQSSQSSTSSDLDNIKLHIK